MNHNGALETIEFPHMRYELMESVKFPHMRYQLMVSIRDLSDMDYQRQEWVVPTRKHAFWDSIMLAYHFIFDDMNFCGGQDETALGTILYDQEELDAVVKFAKIFDDTITAIGDEQPDAAYIDSPLWLDVVDAAKKAYAVMKIRGGDELEDV